MRKFLISVVLLAFVGGACGGAKKESAADLRAQLLTAAEFSPAYKRTNVDVDNKNTDPIGCPQLDQIDEKYLKTTEHTVEAGYQNGDDSTSTQFANETIYSFKSIDDANAYFDAEVDGFNACKTFRTTDKESGGESSYQTQQYAFPKVGDESYASSITINGVVNGQAQTVAGPLVIVRKEKKFIGMLFFHVGAQPGLSGGEVEAIVRKAADKI